MSLETVAQHLASKGRGNDSMLIHMTPNEISGLQQLAEAHGGSLTTNPNTGLPEAGFLDGLFETIAPIGLGVLGTSMGLSPLMASLGTGALATVLSGGDLGKGIMAGMGAYGGAGLGESLMKAGTDGATKAATYANVAGNSGQEAANAVLSSQMATAPLTQTLPTSGGLSLGGAQSVQPALQQAAQQAVIPNTEGLMVNLPTSTMQQTPSDLMRAGFNNVTSSGQNMWNFVKDNPMPFISAGTGLLSSMGQPEESNDFEVDKGGIAEFSYDQGYDPKGTNNYFYRPKFTQTGYKKLAAGGIASLGPRFLEGGGTGLSDDIPATIEGKEPAALADGEFVVSADVVSALGGGSSKAGAQKLYDMMDRVRKQAHGTTKQVRPVDEQKALPI